MNPEIKVICQYKGGSHLYGTSTPTSDIDHRGVFINTSPHYILGTKKYEEQRNQNNIEKVDIVLKEIRHFFELLKRANTEAYECLFAPINHYDFITSEFHLIRSNAIKFISSKNLFSCIRGYSQGELRRALGQEKLGILGEARRESLNKYGYSPKNFIHLLRLLYTGIIFFSEDRYVTNLSNEGDFYKKLLEIKRHPENFSINDINNDYEKYQNKLVDSFEKRAITYEFDDELANEILLEIYYPFLNNSWNKKQLLW